MTGPKTGSRSRGLTEWKSNTWLRTSDLQCLVGFGGGSWVDREVNLSVISDCKAPHKTAVSPQRIDLNHKSINRSAGIGPRCCVIELIKLHCRYGVVTFRNRREACWKSFHGMFSSIRIDRL